MIYLFHGTDYISSRVALRSLLTSYQKSEVSQFVGDTFDFQEFKNICETLPMFSKKRLLVIEGKLGGAILEQIIGYFDILPDHAEIAFWRNTKLKRNNLLVQSIHINKGKIHEFKMYIREDIFPLLDAIAMKNKKKAFLALIRLLQLGVEATYIIKMIAWQFRNIIYLTLDCQAKNSIHPFVLAKAKNSTKIFNKDELINIYSRILDTEISLKTGTLEGSLLLSRLLWDIL